jgi:hypothetical protein
MHSTGERQQDRGNPDSFADWMDDKHGSFILDSSVFNTGLKIFLNECIFTFTLDIIKNLQMNMR